MSVPADATLAEHVAALHARALERIPAGLEREAVAAVLAEAEELVRADEDEAGRMWMALVADHEDELAAMAAMSGGQEGGNGEH